MPSSKVLTRSFAGGEITPEMYGRLDNVKFQTGLAKLLNGYVLPHGPATKRPGFGYVNRSAEQEEEDRVRVIPFAFSADQSMVIEISATAIRFHTDGATLLQTGDPWNSGSGYEVGEVVSHDGDHYYATVPSLNQEPPDLSYWALVDDTYYEVPSPYTGDDIFNLTYTQSADVLSITSQVGGVRELRRLGAAQWALVAAELGTNLPPPPDGDGEITEGTGTPYPKQFYYKVTVVTADGLEESLPLLIVPEEALINDLTLPGSKNFITWDAPDDVTDPSYRIYKAVNDEQRLYGFMGETKGLSFTDDNITPDYSHNPPAQILRLDTEGNYPAAVGYYEQRRVFGGTANNPQGVYMTRTGTESDLAVSIPGNDVDALSFTIKAQQQNAIRHLVPLSDLLALSVGGVWRIFSNNGPLLPTTISVKPQTFYGANNVQPALTGHSSLYAESNGRRIRDIGYSWEAQTYTSDDRSIMAPHLFLQYTIMDMAYCKSPDQILWCVRSDGKMLSMAYVPEHQVFGWSQHDTQGRFESVCVVSENSEDVLYVVVWRDDGDSVPFRTVERMISRQFPEHEDAFFVDCGMTYEGEPADLITGLPFDPGWRVVALADGAVVRDLEVDDDNSITLPAEASKVHIGLAYTMDLQTLPMAVEGAEAGGQGTVKGIDYAYVRVNRSGPFAVGPDFDSLVDMPIRTNEPYGSPPRLQSRQLDIMVQPDLGPDAQLCLRSADPAPLTVSSITVKVTLGG